jgi:hypothetical protein
MARTLLLRGSWVSSTLPRASRSDGTYIPKRRDSPCGGRTSRRPGCPGSAPTPRRCRPWRALLIGGAEVDPVALLDEPRVKVVDTSELVLQLSRSDLAEQCGWVSGLVRPHGVGRGFWGRAELPRVVFGSCRHSWDCRRRMLSVSSGVGWQPPLESSRLLSW